MIGSGHPDLPGLRRKITRKETRSPVIGSWVRFSSLSRHPGAVSRSFAPHRNVVASFGTGCFGGGYFLARPALHEVAMNWSRSFLALSCTVCVALAGAAALAQTMNPAPPAGSLNPNCSNGVNPRNPALPPCSTPGATLPPVPNPPPNLPGATGAMPPNGQPTNGTSTGVRTPTTQPGIGATGPSVVPTVRPSVGPSMGTGTGGAGSTGGSSASGGSGQ
jgi:hypothetical protein